MIGDDLGLALGSAIKTLAPHALDYVWDKVKTIAPVKKILNFLRDRLGIDTNDDMYAGTSNY